MNETRQRRPQKIRPRPLLILLAYLAFGIWSFGFAPNRLSAAAWFFLTSIALWLVLRLVRRKQGGQS